MKQVISQFLSNFVMYRVIKSIRYITNRTDKDCIIIIFDNGLDAKLIFKILNFFWKKIRLFNLDEAESILVEIKNLQLNKEYYIYVPKNEYWVRDVGSLISHGFNGAEINYIWFPVPDINPPFNTYDHLLGLTRDDDGYITHWGGGQTDYTIYILGNSTSDATFAHLVSWPEFLYSKLTNKGFRVKVVDLAVIRINSSQELIKLIRDIIPNRPHMVICMSGVCNIDTNYKDHIVSGHKYSWDYQKKLFESMLLGKKMWIEKNQYCRIDKISYGLEDNRSFAKWWIDDIRMMRACCKEFNIEYIAFLQPNIYMCGSIDNGIQHINLDNQYVDGVRRWHQEIRKNIAELGLDYICDISDLLSGNSQLFWDTCHVFEDGNRKIANKVYEEIIRFLDKN